jgi:hypothetical protein
MQDDDNLFEEYEQMGLPGEDLIYADGYQGYADMDYPLEFITHDTRGLAYREVGHVIFTGESNPRHIFGWLDTEMNARLGNGPLSVAAVSDPKQQLGMYLGTFYHAIMYRYFACYFITARS